MTTASNLSIVTGERTPPLLALTIGDALDRAADSHGDTLAVVMRHQGVRMSFEALRYAADATARGFIALGLEPGARVGIWAPNCIEWVVTQFAAAKAGLILVCINPAYRETELEHALNLSGCSALILGQPFKTSDYPAMMRNLAPEIAEQAAGELRSERLPALRWLFTTGDARAEGMLSFAEIASRGHAISSSILAERQRGVNPDDATNIQFTSGTTGSPKGATLTHRNLVNNAFFTARRERLGEGDRLNLPLPLYHCFGMVLGSLACIIVGATAIYPAPAFDAGETLAALDEERCTAMYGVPTMFLAVLDHPDFGKADLSALRTGIMGGAPCPESVMRRAMEQMGMVDVTIAFGMTETSPTSFQTLTSDNIALRLQTVGQVHPHLEARIVDEVGAVVSRGVPGEIQVRGYSVMQGYWNDPQRTAAAIDEEGWMRTGDIGVLDAAGYCRIVGRAKDLIIRGGENIFPREVEEVLHAHPGVADVHVFGVRDERLGEEVCAWIQLINSTQVSPVELQQFCREKLSHFKAPRHIRFVDEFPMTVTGKAQKFVMQEKMEAELAAASGQPESGNSIRTQPSSIDAG